MLRKTLSVLLAAVLTAALFAGCQADQPAASQNAGDRVKIEWLAYNTYGQPNPDEPLIQYVQDRYNVEFEFWFVDDQRWEEVLGVRLAGGDMPDFMRVKDSGMLPTYIRQGIVAEVTDEMLARMPNYTATVNYWDPLGFGFQDAYFQDKLYLMKEANPGGAYPTAIV